MFSGNCASCRHEWRAVDRWLRYNKYNIKGQRLCSNMRCSQRLTTANLCQNHEDEYKEMLLLRRLQKSGAVAMGPRADPRRLSKLGRLSTVLSKEEVGEIFSALAKVRRRPWRMHTQWRHVEDSMTEDDYAGPFVFYTDTESMRIRAQPGAQHTVLTPYEIAILDRRGKPILRTPVDWGQRICDVFTNCPPQYINKACTIYGAESASQMTNGMTPQEIIGRLRKVGFFSPGAILIEHSTSKWDWTAISLVVGENNMPQVALQTFDLLKMMGWTGPENLQTLYFMMYPESKINSKHHRAFWDVAKMYIFIKCVFSCRVVEESEVSDLVSACEACGWQGSHEEISQTSGSSRRQEEEMAERQSDDEDVDSGDDLGEGVDTWRLDSDDEDEW